MATKIFLNPPAWGLRLFLMRQTNEIVNDYFVRRPNGSDAASELINHGLAKRVGDALVYTPAC